MYNGNGFLPCGGQVFPSILPENSVFKYSFVLGPLIYAVKYPEALVGIDALPSLLKLLVK